MKKYSYIFTLITLFSVLTHAQTWPGKFYSGYTRSLSAGKFSYHSPQPDVTNSLLLRSIDSLAYIAWETEMIAPDLNDPFVNFIWMFGIDANNNSHKYKLFLNGVFLLTFSNPLVSDIKPWKVLGIKGSELFFRTTLLDKYDDPMGYAILKVPAELLKKGATQEIKVVGESAGSNVWYMTFESQVMEKFDILQEEAVLNENGKQVNSILFNFVHPGEPVKGRIVIQGIVKKSFLLEPGYNRIPIFIPEVNDAVSYDAVVTIEGTAPVSRTFNVNPVRHWTIDLVQHTHTDIGYTRPQTEILPEHLRYIDYALDYCDQTDSYPEAARFRWTCETSWAVKEYLNTRPKSQVERLKKRISEGRIEVTGLFLNSSDLSDETSVAASLQPVKQFRESGIPVRSAMQDDINGVPWCLVDYLSGCRINFLTMGQNDTRAVKPFDRPTTFWWESPSGNRIIVNRPEHYMWGNSLGILTNTETFGRALFLHLNTIRKKGYPYDRYAIQFSGYLTDNSPPSTTACELVRQWNEKYVWPKLRLSTIGEFGDWVSKNHSNDLPVYRGAWPDWWMDGFGSAFLETAYTRMAHEDYIANVGLMSMVKMMGEPIPGYLASKQQEVTEAILFYDEHTFGAAESISEPLAENSVVQWGEKSAYAWEAVKKNRIIREEVLGILQPYIPKSKGSVITVFNTLNWDRSGIATVYVDHQIIPKNKSFRIVDENEGIIPAQLVMQREEGSYWAIDVRRIPAMGYKNLRVWMDGESGTSVEKEPFNGTLENNRYKIIIDLSTGSISSLYDKKLKLELVDPANTWQLGRFIYETLGKNRSQLEQLKLGEFKRIPLSDITVGGITKGPVWNSITLNGKIEGCADKDGVSCEIRIYHSGDQKIEFLFSMKKLAVSDPEAVYVAFPFHIKNGKLVCEMQGGTMVPGKDQIPGSSSDWQGVQNFVSVRGDSTQVVFVSPEAPLVQLGEINLGKFANTWQPKSTAIYSWVLNNYWTTNFRACQEGELKWRYQVACSSDTSNSFASRFGWGERVPFITRVFPGRNDTVPLIPEYYHLLGPLATFCGTALEELLLVNARPSSDQKGVILQLREITGTTIEMPVHLPVYSSRSDLYMATHFSSAFEVNVLEEKIKILNDWLEFKPFETKFVKLEF